MAKPRRATAAKSDKQNRSDDDRAVAEKLAGELSGPAHLPGIALTAADDGSIEAQADRLRDSRLQTAQRQAVAAHIGAVQGNRHLQRVVASLKTEKPKTGIAHRTSALPMPDQLADDAKEAAEARNIQAQLGSGRALDGSTKSRMESAFGHDFSNVRVHVDAKTTALSRGLGARAFTVGSDIGFDSDAYEPGTAIGDVLVAHELAHVVQQRNAVPSIKRALADRTNGADQDTLEKDASLSAMRAATSLWDGAKAAFATVSADAMPRLRSGLRLQRCSRQLAEERGREAVTHNSGLGYDAQSIRSIQSLVGANSTGAWDMQTVEKVARWQNSRGLTVNGKIDAATLKQIVLALVAASRQNDAIHLIVDAYNLPTTNLARIYYDASLTGADAVTGGTIATGAPQTVQVGPSTFTGSYEHAVKIIGHELQHVQQRSGASPITNQPLREFLAWAWEALDTTTPALTPAERVSHARIALSHWARVPAGLQPSYTATHTRLQTLIANRGVGNP